MFRVLIKSVKYALILALAVSIAYPLYPLLKLDKPLKIQIATGTEAGVYNTIGEKLRNQLLTYPELDGVAVLTKRTSGAIENERLLSSRQVDAAFLQGDASLPKEIKPIARLFTEKIHIIVKRPEIRYIEDLRGQIVGVWSEPGSGTDRLLKKVLVNVGIEFQKISKFSDVVSGSNKIFLYYEKERKTDNLIEPHDIARWFDADYVAALAAVTGDRSLFVSSRLDDNPLNEKNRLLEVKLPPDSALFQGGRVYSAFIPKGVYRKGTNVYPEGPKATIGTDTILAVRSDLQDNVVYQLTRALFDPGFREFEATFSNHIYSKNEQDRNSNYLHSGALAFFKGETPRSPRTLDTQQIVTPLLVIILLLTPKLLLICMELNIPFLKEASPLFYSSIIGRAIIANTLKQAVKEDTALRMLRKEYMELPISLGANTYISNKDLLKTILQHPCVITVIHGEGGTGKTTLLTHIFDLLIAEISLKITIPFFISPGYSTSILSSLVASMKHYGVYANEQILTTLLMQFKSIILIDGIDEVPEATRDKVIADIIGLTYSYPMLRIVLSTRDVPKMSVAHYLIETKLLNRDLAASLFWKLYGSDGSEKPEISNDVLDILDTPLMVKLLAETAKNFGTMPKSRVELFERYTKVIMRESVFGIDYDTSEKILRKLAAALIEGAHSRFTMDMAEAILVPIIQELESRRGKLLSAYNFMKVAIAAGIIKRDGPVLRFFHISVMHYFVALELREMEVSNPKRLEELRASNFAAEAFEVMESFNSR